MREVNFSIPNVNKASVGITTALYDRRALDCTSTLPLINSLNHLAYLTTSSARIRDILCVDGGVERLVCILKQGRSKEMMEMWKWNLAFQCVVNIGVRGSESVRTRVVEADMVPVIASLLNNYIQIVEHCREKAAESEARRARVHGLSKSSRHHHHNTKEPSSRSSHGIERGTGGGNVEHHRSSRRNPPPPSIEIPQPLSPTPVNGPDIAMDLTPTAIHLSSPADPSPFPRPAGHARHLSHQHPRSPDTRTSGSRLSLQPPAPSGMLLEPTDPARLRPVRDAERLPSMLPLAQGTSISQPSSPTTPNAAVTTPIASASRTRRRGSLRQQQSSTSGDSDDGSTDVNPEEQEQPEVRVEGEEAPMVDIRPPEVNIEGAEDGQDMLEAVQTPMNLNENGSEGQDTNALNFNRTGLDGSIIATNLTTPTPDATDAVVALRPTQTPMPSMSGPAPSPSHQIQGRYVLDRTAPPGVLAATPRDEDVLMSLQLLAYVSKYCNLRTYFQRSHLVPKLRIDPHLKQWDDPTLPAVPEASNEGEYLLPDDFNIFPLVERFTVRHHSQDMQYWAGVVMRNLCRKDDSKGGIRQCAYYKCGKWEEWTRQFAKCRRCRRTKYCSKECQKNAWVYHRHWCQNANQALEGDGTGDKA